MKIAFIGLGNMGGGMAANLVKAGHNVRAFDLAEEALAKAKANGCETFATVREAVSGVDAVVSMLPNGAIVDKVYAEDVIGHAPKGAVLLDCSTIDVATAKKVVEAATAAGYEAVDAPVSGGIAAANAATLTFMVGGTDSAFARAEPLLAKMGKAVIHAGAAGAGAPRRPTAVDPYEVVRVGAWAPSRGGAAPPQGQAAPPRRSNARRALGASLPGPVQR